MSLRLVVIALVSLNLAACVSGPRTQLEYYLLPQAVPQEALQGCPSGNLPKVSLARLYQADGIVVQTSAVQWHPARLHRWATPLAEQLGYAIAAKPQWAAWACAQQATLKVQSFYGSVAGEAVLQAVWQWPQTVAAETETPSYRYYPVSARVGLTDDGYPALVKALDAALQRVLEAPLPTD